MLKLQSTQSCVFWYSGIVNRLYSFNEAIFPWFPTIVSLDLALNCRLIYFYRYTLKNICSLDWLSFSKANQDTEWAFSKTRMWLKHLDNRGTPLPSPLNGFYLLFFMWFDLCCKVIVTVAILVVVVVVVVVVVLWLLIKVNSIHQFCLVSQLYSSPTIPLIY